MALANTATLTMLKQALHRARTHIRWKPGKAQAHLIKRQSRGHLPPEATIAEYEAVISAVLHHPDAVVYVYQYGAVGYPTVVAPCEGRLWLAMVGAEGVMETAFPPDDAKTYFEQDPKYRYLGKLKELLE